MICLDASDIAAVLADERLLEPEKYEEFVAAMLPLCQDLPILGRELVYRGWLTSFQLEQIVAGQAEGLFLGSYVLIAPLGEGGMGRVYLARNYKLDCYVAIKVMRDEQARRPAVLARFHREIRALGRIRHPNIVQAIDADALPGAIYYVMQHFEGIDLGRFVRQNGPLLVADACDYVLQVADALKHASQNGLIHRDIKPSNLLLTEPDHMVKVLDLGLTRCEVPESDSIFNELTRAGTIIGTPDYMPPEQIKDSRSADIRSDLYSLGCTFYYLLSGRAPFEHLTATVDKLCAHEDLMPTPIRHLRPDVPPEVASIVERLMAKRRRDRIQTPDALMAELRDVVQMLYSPMRDTLVDTPALTLIDVPMLPILAEIPRTVVFEEGEIDVMTQARIEPEPPPRRQCWYEFHPLQLLIATVLAALALVVLWQSGYGPNAGR